MKRTKHPLSHYRLATFDLGELVPVANFEVLPGDSIRMSTSALLRCSPLVTPVMHPVQVCVHHWFVPHRLSWPSDWEKFITGGTPATPYPVLSADTTWDEGMLPDYLGVPPLASGSSDVSAFPIRAYNRIFNENYRDQDLVSEVDEDSVALQRIAWEKDYFTAARPWTQKGPEVTVPLGGEAPVRGFGTTATTGVAQANVRETGGDVVNYAAARVTDTDTYMRMTGVGPGAFPDVYADLSAATSVPVNMLREAFGLQRYEEARAQFGSRYTEYLRYLGVRSSDARLQRPEYLGGGRATISFTEVLRTGNQDDASEDQPIGQMRGHGIAGLRTRTFVKYFEEHGTVLTLASVRPRSMYADGLHRGWLRRTPEDYWQKELELIGQQEISSQEVLFLAGNGTPWGYQDRYSEYRHHPSGVSGEFRSLLADWHMARFFGSLPSLNSNFVTCNPSKRNFAVQTNDVLWCLFNHSIQARRMVGNRTIGRII